MNKEYEPKAVEVKLMLESLSNVGQIVPVESSKALQEFTEIYDRLRTYLLEVSKLANHTDSHEESDCKPG